MLGRLGRLGGRRNRDLVREAASVASRCRPDRRSEPPSAPGGRLPDQSPAGSSRRRSARASSCSAADPLPRDGSRAAGSAGVDRVRGRLPARGPGEACPQPPEAGRRPPGSRIRDPMPERRRPAARPTVRASAWPRSAPSSCGARATAAVYSTSASSRWPNRRSTPPRLVCGSARDGAITAAAR